MPVRKLERVILQDGFKLRLIDPCSVAMQPSEVYMGFLDVLVKKGRLGKLINP